MNPRTFFAELKRRHVYKVAVGYGVVGWVVMQVAATNVLARAQLGETDAAIACVVHLLDSYGETSLTPALLRLDPLWNPLRSDPRFEKISKE